ncbi:4070_t:CDS:1, partial [Ambispora leptoticha]
QKSQHHVVNMAEENHECASNFQNSLLYPEATEDCEVDINFHYNVKLTPEKFESNQIFLNYPEE